jgi:hypothetical protein
MTQSFTDVLNRIQQDSTEYSFHQGITLLNKVTNILMLMISRYPARKEGGRNIDDLAYVPYRCLYGDISENGLTQLKNEYGIDVRGNLQYQDFFAIYDYFLVPLKKELILNTTTQGSFSLSSCVSEQSLAYLKQKNANKVLELNTIAELYGCLFAFSSEDDAKLLKPLSHWFQAGLEFIRTEKNHIEAIKGLNIHNILTAVALYNQKNPMNTDNLKAISTSFSNIKEIQQIVNFFDFSPEKLIQFATAPIYFYQELIDLSNKTYYQSIELNTPLPPLNLIHPRTAYHDKKKELQNFHVFSFLLPNNDIKTCIFHKSDFTLENISIQTINELVFENGSFLEQYRETSNQLIAFSMGLEKPLSAFKKYYLTLSGRDSKVVQDLDIISKLPVRITQYPMMIKVSLEHYEKIESIVKRLAPFITFTRSFSDRYITFNETIKTFAHDIDEQVEQKKPLPQLKFIKGNSSNSLEPDKKDFVIKIENQIAQLTREIYSFWPYPNKDRKRNKIKGLETILATYKENGEARILDAINQVEAGTEKGFTDVAFKDLRKGRNGGRTGKILDDIKTQFTIK